MGEGNQTPTGLLRMSNLILNILKQLKNKKDRKKYKNTCANYKNGTNNFLSQTKVNRKYI